MYSAHPGNPYPASPSASYASYPYNVHPQVPPGFADYGPHPFVINIEQATMDNPAYRVALWTGEHLQLTLMSIDVGDEIGLEVHPDGDQFIRVEQGQGIVLMGDNPDALTYQAGVSDDHAIFIPAGKWHNLINIGSKPLKVYVIYAPPEHPRGTVHLTKADGQYH